MQLAVRWQHKTVKPSTVYISWDEECRHFAKFGTLIQSGNSDTELRSFTEPLNHYYVHDTVALQHAKLAAYAPRIRSNCS